MSPLIYPLVLPFVLGLFCFAVPKGIKTIREVLATAGSIGTLGMVIWLFSRIPDKWTIGNTSFLKISTMSGFIALAVGFFGVVVVLYSIRFMADNKKSSLYYGSLLLTLSGALGVLFSNHLILFLSFWGFLGITLYLLILTGGDDAAPAAKKTLILIGGSDAFMLLGIGLFYSMTSTFVMDQTRIPLHGVIPHLTFICLFIGVLAKAGAVPLHTWIPDVSMSAPIPVTAFLPAALDKLLGIYLMGQLCLNLFRVSNGMNILILSIGSITLVIGVMMALVQHDLRQLLAYHSISQVGYMLMGLGTGNPIGIIGGLFHMLNNSIYKAGLFLAGGNVQHSTESTDLDNLGGLGKMMPVTFISFMVFAISISGIPPFNGFFSKWLIYQGFLELGKSGDKLWILWLIVAMFGSALTLASFMKLLHAVFLGIPSEYVRSKNVKEVGLGMVFSPVVLAFLCILFGLFAYGIPLKYFLVPSVSEIVFPGSWSPGLAALLLLGGLVVGFIIYFIGNLKNVRQVEPFIGGEKLLAGERVTGTQFYTTIQNMKGIRRLYAWTENRWFDLYDQGSRVALGLAGVLRRLHTGVLTLYLIWFLLGLIFLFVIFMGVKGW